MDKPYLEHLNSANDLVTSYEAVRAGFVSLALEKNRRATPWVELARALKLAASAAKVPRDLLKLPSIQSSMLTASGVSDKALSHIEETDKRDAITNLIKNFLEPAGSNFIEELVYRFLLIRGDTLGGAMRNVGGALAQRKLTRSILSYLKLTHAGASWKFGKQSTWNALPVDDTDIELQLTGLTWESSGRSRTLLYNHTVPFFRNNVDLCLFGYLQDKIGKQPDPTSYIALGELKGGIDPAGADEHWKTARSALNRIQDGFKKLNLHPHTFFIGAAIENKMATEIWESLQTGVLKNAANLTNEEQLASLTRWLCEI